MNAPGEFPQTLLEPRLFSAGRSKWWKRYHCGGRDL